MLFVVCLAIARWKVNTIVRLLIFTWVGVGREVCILSWGWGRGWGDWLWYCNYCGLLYILLWLFLMATGDLAVAC